MNRTITALFDSREDADRARSKLMTAGVTDAQITAQGEGYGDAATGGGISTSTANFNDSVADPVQDVTEGDYGDANSARRGGGGGLWSSLKSLFSDDDAPAYEEGLRRGHFLLTAHVEDELADEAVRILEDSEAVDVDRRVEEWRSAGWTGGATQSNDDRLQGILGDDTLKGTSGDDQVRASGSDRLDSNEAIPIVEETLRVGKREVGRGGVRVRSYVRETPVTEQVSLREEHVNIERRPVDQPLSAAGGDLFQDRTIEMTETAEEAVVAKEARVTEELTISKDIDQRTETISDTVRHTEVDVEDTRSAGSTRSFAGVESTGGADLLDGESEEDRRTRLAATPTTTAPSV
jgi:uncharacterized protein (TIGR02271 family)